MAEPFDSTSQQNALNLANNLEAPDLARRIGTVNPPKMYIRTLEPLAGQKRVITAQFNPETFKERVEAKYVGWEIPGLSHEVLQFIATKNVTLPFELRFIVDQRLGKSTELYKRFMEYRRILFALAYPRPIGRGRNTVNGASPHRVLVVWPGLTSLTCVLKSVEWEYMQFNSQAMPIDMRATVEFQEIRDVRIDADEVFIKGTLRGGDDGGNVDTFNQLNGEF